MESRPWLPYVVPFGIYALFLAIQSPQNLVWVYPLQATAVGASLWILRKHYDELQSPMICEARVSAGGATAGAAEPSATGALALQSPSTKGTFALQSWILAVAVGLVVIAIWIGIDPYYPKLGSSAAFDASGKWLFIVFRIAGAAVVVPLMEELFWRAFLIRWFIDLDFKRVPIGTFTWTSFAFTVGLFGLEHHEWLAGLICGALYNWLYYKRKDVFACVVAHAVSNGALAAWVLARGQWKFW